MNAKKQFFEFLLILKRKFASLLPLFVGYVMKHPVDPTQVC